MKPLNIMAAVKSIFVSGMMMGISLVTAVMSKEDATLYPISAILLIISTLFFLFSVGAFILAATMKDR